MKLSLVSLCVVFLAAVAVWGQTVDRDAVEKMCLSVDDAAKVLGQKVELILTEPREKGVLCTYESRPEPDKGLPDQVAIYIALYDTVEAAREAYARNAADGGRRRKGLTKLEDVGDEAIYVPFTDKLMTVLVRVDKRLFDFILAMETKPVSRDVFVANVKSVLR